MSEKTFLTYNQQMKLLRNHKQISCNGSANKKLLVRSGYFNLINGYKSPFISGKNNNGDHIYLKDTTINQLYAVKSFDDSLRCILLKYITQIEEEVRTLTGYKFDECNEKGKIPWYHTDSFDPSCTLQDKMRVISKAYREVSESHQDYVHFYMKNHKQIPTWIMLKVVNFSTFIDVLQYSKKDVIHSICILYGMYDENDLPFVKLLIGSLHWMRKIRNSCAHNERVYCISGFESDHRNQSGRINEQYFKLLRQSYTRSSQKKTLFDLFVYFKYYLPKTEYKRFIKELLHMLDELQSEILPAAFDYVRGQIGIKDLADLETLASMPKDEIDYNHFDKS